MPWWAWYIAGAVTGISVLIALIVLIIDACILFFVAAPNLQEKEKESGPR